MTPEAASSAGSSSEPGSTASGRSSNQSSSSWSANASDPDSEEAHYHALHDHYRDSLVRTCVVPNCPKSNKVWTDSDSDNSQDGPEGVNDDNAQATNEATPSPPEDTAIPPISAASVRVAGLRAEIKMLKLTLESANKRRAEEVNAARQTQIQLYMFAGKVQALYKDSICIADSMVIPGV